MRILVIGDVSWRGSYHLGDEAMTEVAITQLQHRGAEVTLIAGDPGISATFYGVDTVPQFGYRSLATREDWTARLAEIDATLAGERETPEYAAATLAAIDASDAVVIAGGGNLNSKWAHHIFERLTLKRAAEARGIPLYITSQTVGPELDAADRELLAEILSYARVFGAREGTTAQLMRELGGDGAPVVHTLDDAILLEPAELSSKQQNDLSLPERYIVGSFTFHSFSTGLTHEEYYRAVAALLDDAVATTDADILLLPHMGTLENADRSDQRSDVYGHDRIVAHTRSGRVRSLPMMPARELLAVTASAMLTLSTRYHPVIFGVGVGTPAVGLVISYYSAVRVRGALRNVGMEEFAIPFEAWQPYIGRRLLESMSNNREAIAAHVVESGAKVRAYQHNWWDGIVADIAGSGAVVTTDAPEIAPLGWADERTAESLALARLAQEGVNLLRVNIAADERGPRGAHAAHAEIAELRQQNKRLEHELAAIRHRLRPPGANLRDRLRRKLRGR
ncbi:polysaccharide pyruvyl transferase family protein [Leucobacter viscericola]|uniref:Polysaccharide pyruvyl transferase family protein n=1 Tax=Leucobacter viscericola TaxID=2714935 RepID=A0A6G7XF00_9MICO|nr:polysaccharide pyruvyl transferase family protein [Leucobacter viscericola]QIK63019.1 polysaccharide pyruvyl transferase family protein [Leucobacter viscericola]